MNLTCTQGFQRGYHDTPFVLFDYCSTTNYNTLSGDFNRNANFTLVQFRQFKIGRLYLVFINSGTKPAQHTWVSNRLLRM